MQRSNQKDVYQLLYQYLGDKANDDLIMVDIGSYEVNNTGTLRPSPGLPESATALKWEYIGVDLNEGPNVDVVMPDPYHIPLACRKADVVVSVNTFNYVQNPFTLMKEISRILKPQGLVVVEAAASLCDGTIGVSPDVVVQSVDTFRYCPGGMRALFTEADLTVLEIFQYNSRQYDSSEQISVECKHTWGVARKDGY
jgi:SAM-dependent methyltransferase